MTTAALPLSTPSADSRSELMFLGKECHHPACHLHDFLPFEVSHHFSRHTIPHSCAYSPRCTQMTGPTPPSAPSSAIHSTNPQCPACHLSYCQPHFLPSQHTCSAPLPASMIDRIAPTCPLCNTVVPTASSRDPNESVEKHILDGICVGLPGGEERKREEVRRKKERGEVCWRKGCVKGLIVPMKCEVSTFQSRSDQAQGADRTSSPMSLRGMAEMNEGIRGARMKVC